MNRLIDNQATTKVTVGILKSIKEAEDVKVNKVVYADGIKNEAVMVNKPEEQENNIIKIHRDIESANSKDEIQEIINDISDNSLAREVQDIFDEEEDKVSLQQLKDDTIETLENNAIYEESEELTESKVTDYIKPEELNSLIMNNAKAFGGVDSFTVLDNMLIQVTFNGQNTIYKLTKTDSGFEAFKSSESGEAQGKPFALVSASNESVEEEKPEHEEPKHEDEEHEHEEPEERVTESIEIIANDANKFLLKESAGYIVGKNYNKATGIIEEADTYKSRKFAEKVYKSLK